MNDHSPSLRRLAAALLLVAAAAAVPRHRLSAQDTLVVTLAPADSVAPRSMAPLGAFFRSLLVPGWAQASLDRKLTASLFVAWEGVTLGMTLKASHELAYLERIGSSRADDKRAERQDWLVLLVFNHLFAGLEAYVSSHLIDFPADVRVRALPGAVGGAVTLPIRWP